MPKSTNTTKYEKRFVLVPSLGKMPKEIRKDYAQHGLLGVLNPLPITNSKHANEFLKKAIKKGVQRA